MNNKAAIHDLLVTIVSLHENQCIMSRLNFYLVIEEN